MPADAVPADAGPADAGPADAGPADEHDLDDLDAALEEMARGTDLVLDSVDGFSEADVREPSLLPGWTRAHVLSHLARQADGLANLAHWARTGEERAMYDGGPDARDRAVEEGARNHLGDLRLDLADSAERLLGGFVGFPQSALARVVRGPRGASFAAWELPLMRIREVEIHNVDLAAGYTPADWSRAFVSRTLDQLTPQFLERGDCPVASLSAADGGAWRVGSAGPVLVGDAADLLAWLVGRGGAGLLRDPPGELPVAPRWR